MINLVTSGRIHKKAAYFDDASETMWKGAVIHESPKLIYSMRGALRNTLLLEACRPDTSMVIEIGSGAGFHLPSMWLAGGPKDATYHALEITRTGRLCTEVMAKLEPSLKMSAHPFNYFAPQYPFISKRQPHIMVYTNGSIEQISNVREDVFTKFLDSAERVTGVHFEPIGWQIVPEDKHSKLMRRNKEHCIKNDYNQNFWSLLNKMQSDGRIKIDRSFVDLFGKTKHPASYVSWRKVA